MVEKRRAIRAKRLKTIFLIIAAFISGASLINIGPCFQASQCAALLLLCSIRIFAQR